MTTRDPYLPEHAPPPPEQPKTNAKRTLLLWIVLIVLFLTIWQFLNPADNGSAPPPRCVAPCVEPSVPWISIIIGGVPIAVVVLFFVIFMRKFRANTSFNADQEPAFQAMAQRRFGEAVSLFRALSKKYEKQPAFGAMVDLGMADAEVWAGNLDAAIDACVAVDKMSMLGLATRTRLVAASELAFLYALAGELDAAETWRGTAHLRLAKTNDARMASAAKLRLADAVILCRRGKAREAIDLLEEGWLTLRFSFIANWMRVAEVIRAFAEAQGDLREQNVVAGRLVRIEPIVGNELAFLGRKWPEMHAFLAAHGLSQTPP